MKPRAGRDSCAMIVILLSLAIGASAELKFHANEIEEEWFCKTLVQLSSGKVCGAVRTYVTPSLEQGAYRSYQGVPYGRQPIGDRRFKELDPPEVWEGYLEAEREGPVCPQHDVFYGRLMKPHGMSEECIFANVYVPDIKEEPTEIPEPSPDLQPPPVPKSKMPIFVFVHGGGFAFGSGDSDMHGPDFLVARGFMVVTFNYRLGPLGFLSLNSSKVPGNAGLRDIVSLLKWVRQNAEAFGGNPADVTLGGQSAGAAAVHLLTLSKAAEGLFHKAVLMSGTGTKSFFSSSPLYSEFQVPKFLSLLGIDANTTSSEEIYQQLINIKLDKIMAANKIVQEQNGLGAFYPTVESHHQGVTPILDEDPEVLLEKGQGKDIPMMVGFAESECDVFAARFAEIDITSQLRTNPIIMVPPALVFTTPTDLIPKVVGNITSRYKNIGSQLNDFTRYCSEAYFEYPAISLAHKRAQVGGAPVYLYRFAYQGRFRVFEKRFRTKFGAAIHVEDLTYVMKVKSFVEPYSDARSADHRMQEWMTGFVTRFATCGNPSGYNCSAWEPVKADSIKYQEIRHPQQLRMQEPTEIQQQMIQFYNDLYKG